MQFLLRLRAWIVRLMLNYNEQAERKQAPTPLLHDIIESVASPSARGFVNIHIYTPPGYVKSSPNQKSKYPLVIDFHGGGYSSGRPSMDARWMRLLTTTSTRPVVVAVEYSLCPEYPFPSAVQDAAAAILWLSNEGARKYNLNPKRIVMTGFSAGGGLALASSMWISQYHQDKSSTADQRLTHPLRGIVSIYANLDSRLPRKPAKTALLRFLYSVWDDAFTRRSPVHSPFVSPAAADDELLEHGLPERIGLYAAAEDPYVETIEKFRKHLAALGKQVTGYIEPGADHAWDKMRVPAGNVTRLMKRHDWFTRMARDVEEMLK